MLTTGSLPRGSEQVALFYSILVQYARLLSQQRRLTLYRAGGRKFTVASFHSAPYLLAFLLQVGRIATTYYSTAVSPPYHLPVCSPHPPRLGDHTTEDYHAQISQNHTHVLNFVPIRRALLTTASNLIRAAITCDFE